MQSQTVQLPPAFLIGSKGAKTSKEANYVRKQGEAIDSRGMLGFGPGKQDCLNGRTPNVPENCDPDYLQGYDLGFKAGERLLEKIELSLK